MIRILFFIFILSFDVNASSISYFTLNSYPSLGRFSSPSLACEAAKPSGWLYRLVSGQSMCQVRPSSLDTWGDRSFINGPFTIDCPFGNTGLFCNSSCDSPSTIVNGQCVAPVECSAGEIKEGNTCRSENKCDRLKGRPIRVSLPEGYQGTAANSGCTVSLRPSGVCTTFDDGSMGTCLFYGEFTGETEEPDAPPPVETPDPTDADESELDDDLKPNTESSQSCTTKTEDAEGRQHYTCTSTASAVQAGKCSVGQVNGQTVCIEPQNPGSKSQTKERTDEVTETNLADGKKEIKTETTNNTTTCLKGSCQTITNKTSNVTVVDGAGNKISESTTCTGSNCPGSETLEENEAGMPTKVEHPEIKGPEIGSDSDLSFADATSAYYARISNAPIVSAISSVSLPAGGSCSFGSASLWGGSISFNSFCDFAPQVLSGLRYIFLAIWAWAAIRVFASA